MTIKTFIQKNKYQLIFLLTAFFLYGNTLKNDYGLDDELVAGKKSIAAKGIKAIPKIFTSFHVIDESGNTYEYRPLVKVSFAIEYQIFGVSITVSHFFNILLYGLCLILLFKLLKIVFSDHSDFIIAVCVLIFAFIPVHTEVVGSFKNRDILLCFIFTIWGAINFLEFSESKKIVKGILGFVLIAAAFLSKFEVLPYLLTIPLLIYQKQKGGFKYIISVLVLFLLSYYVFKYLKSHLLAKGIKHRLMLYFENPLFFEKTLALRASTLLNCMGFYLRMLFFPNKMSCFYGYNAIPVFSYTSLYALMGMVAIPVMVWGFFKWFKNPNWYWYAIVFFGVSISMYLNYPKPAPGIVADRFLFFASIGFAIFLTKIIFFNNKLKKFPSKISEFDLRQKTVSIAIAVICTGLIITRNTEWKNKLTLFESDVKKYPESVKLSQLYCSEVLLEINRQSGLIKENDKFQRLQECETYLKNAINIDSSCTSCYNNLSYILLNFKNDPQEAIIYLNAALRLGEERKEMYCNLGIAYYRLNNFNLSKNYLLKATEMDRNGDFMTAYAVLADVYRKFDIKEGIGFFTKMVQKKPESEQFNLVLANLYMMEKDTISGINYYNKVLKINPGNTQVSGFLNKLESARKR